MALSTDQFKQIMHRIGERVEEEKDRLSELDRVIGDGDHGISMAIGWKSIRDRLQEVGDIQSIGDILKEMSGTFLNTVGASIGPLYGMAFMRASVAAGNKTELNDAELVQLWSAAVGGIRQIGKAEQGDKTMLDTWIPIVESMETAVARREDWPDVFQQAVEAGEEGMLSTREMRSKRGRSGRLGDRSIGSIDPGAASAQLIFSTFVECYQEMLRRN